MLQSSLITLVPSQAGKLVLPPQGKVITLPKLTVRQALHFPSREASSPSQAITPVSSQASGIPPNTTPAHLPSGGGSNSLLAIAHLPSGEGGNSSQATAVLPSSKGSSSSQVMAHLPSGEGRNASQATALLPSSEGNSVPQATNSPQAGQNSNPTRSVRQDHRCPPRHRAPQSSQENSTISWEDKPHYYPPVGPPRFLPMKNLTLSGSLTFPANP